MQTTTTTCDQCGRIIEKPDLFGKTIPIERNGERYEVQITVDFPAGAGKPVNELDTCTDCFWAAVKEAVKNYVTWN